MKLKHLLLLSLCVLILTPIMSLAQTGAIAGTVTDSANAVVPNAKVTVKNVETGATRFAQTTETGAYSITPLAVGTYTLTAESKGFRVAKITDIEITVAQTVTMNVKLSVGSVTEVVEVKGTEVAQVDTETSQVSKIVDNVAIETLPMITRDPYSLVLLSPGTVQSNSSLGGFSVNGSRERNNNFTLDGTDNNDTSVPGIPGGLSSLSPEATQEFRVITNNFMPEYGRNTGAIVDIVTKSGTNQLHGEAHWFGRYNALGARDWFNGTSDPQDPYVRNSFGYSVGGPVKKDKTFFFFNNEFQRFRTARTTTSVVPTDSFKNGILDVDGTPVDFTNPEEPNNWTGLVGMDPTVKKVLDLYPTPNGGLLDGNRGYYFFPTSSRYNSYALTGKVDHRLTDKHNLSLRYIYNKSDDPDAFHDDFLPGMGGTSFDGKSHNLTANLTSTLSNTLINDFKFGVNRADSAFGCGGTDQMAFLGTDSYGRGRDLSLPGLSSFACSSLGDSNGQARRTGTYGLSDTMTFVKGTHTLKYGFEFRFIYDNGFDDFGSRETISFSSYSTQGISSVPFDTYSVTQNMGWLLVGSVDKQNLSQYFTKAGERTANDFRKFRQREYAGYFQDSWKVRSNFTVNYGVRYAFNGVPYETNGNLSNLYMPANYSAPLTFSLAGPGNGRLLYNNDFSMIEPRFGFAWDPFKKGKTSVRGGFGIFHDRMFGNLFGNAKSNPPFEADYAGSPFYDYLLGGEPTLLSGLALAPQMTPSATVQNGARIYPTLLDPNLKMPRSYNWNFGIQHQLTNALTLEVDYVGSQANRILRVVDGNPPDPAKVQQVLNMGIPDYWVAGGNQWYYAYGLVGGEPDLCDITASSCIGLISELPIDNPIRVVNNSAFESAALNKSIAISNYNSLQMKLTKKMSHGISGNVSYTWAHGGDNASDPLVAAEGNRPLPRNSYNLAAEWGNSDFDIRHRVVIDYTLELPFGKGKARLSNGLVGRVLEGWSMSGITSWQTGHPYDIFGDQDSQHTGVSDRAMLVGDPYAPVTIDPTLGSFTGLNKDAFAVTEWSTVSNLGRNRFYGPHYWNFNAVVSKKMKFSERFNAELRIEGYNVFNHPNFGQPDNGIANDTFGYSSYQIGQSDGTTGARQLQVGLKLNF